jgi:WhiB family transcriptional regulator, redox-sensing transcriptional regulator
VQPQANWKESGACNEAADPDLFFGGEDDDLPMDKATVAEARDWCADCSVSRDCLIFSLQGGERFGIWGGYTPEERRRMREQKIGDTEELVLPDLLAVLEHFEYGSLAELVVRIE